VIAMFVPSLSYRLLIGRPFVVTMVGVLYLCFTWRKLRCKTVAWPVLIDLCIAVTASTWIHCSWFLWALPVAAFFLAREWRAAIRLIACILVGVVLGAILTGHPITFLMQTFFHILQSASADVLARRQLVTELRPMGIDPVLILLVGFLLGWRSLRGGWHRGVVDNPVFILAALGWVLGFQVTRFWLDWGAPALTAWIALEIKAELRRQTGVFMLRRLGIALVGGGVFFLAMTNDFSSRWTGNLTREYLDSSKADMKGWMPEPKGIFYSNDMAFFYQTFFKNPHGDWKYVVGFEPSMMPKDDWDIYMKIMWNDGAVEAFQPWVKKMRPIDRLVIEQSKSAKPDIPELEWYYAAKMIWIGRLPQNKTGDAATTGTLSTTNVPEPLKTSK
ncbi:TPA: hypothetical protein DDW35_03465, partial [Candidatus Sumerlaeota bacterium]|nr:hypothetical protein [Candidatus Sumerlaeota bacterium]